MADSIANGSRKCLLLKEMTFVILSSFTYPHVIKKLYVFLSFVEHKQRYFITKNVGNQIVVVPCNFCCMHKKKSNTSQWEPSLSLRCHAHRPLAKHLMHMLYLSGNI